PAFMKSFRRLTTMIARVASVSEGAATVTVLSGDVHHSYAARAALDGVGEDAAPVHQLVCSPVHNYAPRYVEPVFRFGWSHRLAPITRRWARRHGSPALRVSWTHTEGPLFGNTVATIDFTGRLAEAYFEQPDDAGGLTEVARIRLSAARRPTPTATSPDRP
ncbi:alkaline phosphatase family protein, partial [Micromonospora sp. WMMD736]